MLGQGVSFPALLFLAFLVLKLMGYIDWSWWWITSPLWISASLSLAVLLIVLVIAMVVATIR